MFDLNNKHQKLTIDVLYHINDKIPLDMQMQNSKWDTYVKQDITSRWVVILTMYDSYDLILTFYQRIYIIIRSVTV